RTREMMERQVSHLQRIVDDLLDVSRITRGKIELKKNPLDINEIVAHAIEFADPLIESRKHEVVFERSNGPLYVEGDQTRLLQVMVNLVSNAAKYTPAGGTIALSVARENNDVVIKVRDNGVGISERLLPR